MDHEEKIAELRFEMKLAVNRGDLTKADVLLDAIAKLRESQAIEALRKPCLPHARYVHLTPRCSR